MPNLNQIQSHWLQKDKRPFIIAGPCSAESELQVMQTAQELAELRVSLSAFRAGIWKPRTKPGGFEGVGSTGLAWLKNVKETFGFPVATEVATAHHVEAALAADIDILWIGARSSANPFTVQEIAQSLKGTEKTVLLKNPVNTDLALWMGGLERLLAMDIGNLGVIHRGFSSYQKSEYRNPPQWHIAIDFKSQYPNVPILIDPSHICGERTGIAKVLQQAVHLQYDGMMVEVHISPDTAWSDAAQQLTPAAFSEILQHLVLPQDQQTLPTEIERLRSVITDIDNEIISLLASRMETSKKIGGIKKENNIAVYQPERWQEIQQQIREKSEKLGLSSCFTEHLFKMIHEESINRQNDLFRS